MVRKVVYFMLSCVIFAVIYSLLGLVIKYDFNALETVIATAGYMMAQFILFAIKGIKGDDDE